MRYNAGLQHLVHANQCLLHSLPYYIMTSSCLQGLPFRSPVYNTDSMCAGSCVMRYLNQVQQGVSETSPPCLYVL